MPVNAHQEKMRRARQAVKVGADLRYNTGFQGPKGRFSLEMVDARTGEVLESWEKDNVITMDGGILAAILFQGRGGPARGLSMLAVGTGAKGSLLNPDAADPKQRRLEAEIARKTFSSIVFRNAEGGASSVPTNVVDFTTTFGEAEAVGPLNEMGLISPASDNGEVTSTEGLTTSLDAYDATFDVSDKDIMVNYSTFPVVSKPSTAILTITWRLTF